MSRDDALAAIEAVYRDRFAGLVRFAEAITGDEQSALDAVHDGFVRAVRYRHGLRDRASAAGWICRIVANEARRNRPQAIVPVEPVLESTNGHHEGATVRAALAALPERQRLALFLRYYADLDYAGIAEALGISRGTVSATLHAAHSNERALAATGGGGVLHIVTETDLPKVFVDLETGDRREIRGVREVWFDPAHGMRQRESFEGIVQSDVSMTSVHPHAREVYGSLGAGYREALASGEAHVVGEDVVDGTPVYWIRIARRHEVAVSRDTYLPVHFRITGEPPMETRILEYETVDAAPLQAESLAPASGFAEDRGAITLDEAARVLGRPPVTAGRPDAIRRVDLGGTPGVTLESDGVLLTEAAEPADALTMLAGLRGYVPPNGTLVLEGMSGLMRSGGLFVAIHAADQETAIAVARELP